MAMTALELEVDQKADWQVLTVRGEVDVTTTPRVRAQLITLLSEAEPHLIVDLEGVDFLDSSGLGAERLLRVVSHSGSVSVMVKLLGPPACGRLRTQRRRHG